MAERSWRGFTGRDLRRGVIRAGIFALAAGGLLVGTYGAQVELPPLVTVAVAALLLVPLALLEGRGSRRFAGGELGDDLPYIWLLGGLSPILVVAQAAYLSGVLSSGLGGGVDAVADLLGDVRRSPLGLGFTIATAGLPFALVSNYRLKGYANPTWEAIKAMSLIASPLLLTCVGYLFPLLGVALLGWLYSLADWLEATVWGLQRRGPAEALRQRWVRGELDTRQLRLAAYLGHEPARVLLKCDVGYSLPMVNDLSRWVRGLEPFGRVAPQRAALALGRMALPLFGEGDRERQRAAEADLRLAELAVLDPDAIEGEPLARLQERYAWTKDTPLGGRLLHCAFAAAGAQGGWAGTTASRNASEAAEGLAEEIGAEAVRGAIVDALLPWALGEGDVLAAEQLRAGTETDTESPTTESESESTTTESEGPTTESE